MSEWISVKDRLPEDMEEVIVYCGRKKTIGVDCYDNRYEWWCENSDVTHWMPLPEPPKGD